MSDQPTILLVHGAWHGSWCWAPFRKVLEDRGWNTVAIDLPTVHAANKAELTMADDAAAVAAAIREIDGDVVVIAHSYGGVPVTQAATAANVKRIIYVAAFTLDIGESLFAAVGGEKPDWWSLEDGMVTAGSEEHPPRELFFADADADTAARASAELKTQPLAAFTEELTEAAWRNVPSDYVVTDQDAIFPAEGQAGLAARAGSRVHHMNTSHSPFLSQPEALADIVEASI